MFWEVKGIKRCLKWITRNATFAALIVSDNDGDNDNNNNGEPDTLLWNKYRI
jgi:hypothetical protein